MPEDVDKRSGGCLVHNPASWGRSGFFSFVFGECGSPRPGKSDRSSHVESFFQCEEADSEAAEVARQWLACRFQSSASDGALALCTDTFVVVSPTGKWGPARDELRHLWNGTKGALPSEVGKPLHTTELEQGTKWKVERLISVAMSRSLSVWVNMEWVVVRRGDELLLDSFTSSRGSAPAGKV